MSVNELPQDITSYWFDKIWDYNSGRDVPPNARYFRFVIQDAASLQHLANTNLVITYRVKRATLTDMISHCGSPLQMIERCSMALDGNMCEEHRYFDKWAKIDPLYWSDEMIKQTGSRMGIDLANAENDWNGLNGEYGENDNQGVQTGPLPEAVIENGTTGAVRGFASRNQHNPQGRRIVKSVALKNNTESYLYGKWMTFRIPLRHIFRWLGAGGFNGCISGVQTDLRIWFYEDKAMLLNSSFPMIQDPINPGADLQFKTVHLDVARLTTAKAVPLSRQISMVIPDQFEIYRNQLENVGSNNASIFITNSVDRITRLTFFYLLKRKDIGTNDSIDKNYFPASDIDLTDFRCYINDRLIPKTPLTMEYYDETTNDLNTGTALLRGETEYSDVTQLYELYQKRCYNTLENRGDYNWQASGTISYETFRLYYCHITIDVEHGEEYPNLMKNVTVQMTTAADIPDCTLYTVIEKSQNLEITLKNTQTEIRTYS